MDTTTGLAIRQLDDFAELVAVQRLYERIWRPAAGQHPPITAELLRALSKSGGYVAGAFDGGELVGACAGFCSPPAERSLHSHIAGVAAHQRGRDVGYALKLDQRAWALRHGITEVCWTFDPLVRRNAYFNLGKLAAGVAEYLPDFYGHLRDDLNGDGASDRLLVRWRLTDPAVIAASAGHRRQADTTGAAIGLGISDCGMPLHGNDSGRRTVLVAVPADIEALRLADPVAAAQWRLALREVLGGLLAEGARVTGFDRTGWYVVERTAES
ncbi:GNAT family N-acetyltransferase [Crossiella sp. CA198]|uniref:GNAT family N-acetyltransferase n=1 Tax=Crossiella sp. CA198 TaxID=3455607 RepID=UPI003F8CFBB8